MESPIVTVYTNDKNMWLLSGFQYLFRKYWSKDQSIRVVGYTPPKNGLLGDNVSFVSISRRNYPASEWSNGVIDSLDRFIANGEEFMIFMLEDYWLNAPIDHAAIESITEFMYVHERNILRVDLTSDRCQHRQHITEYGKAGHCDLIRTSAASPYQMSFQAAIWNVHLLREVLRPYEDPWQSEIYGSTRLAKSGDNYIVLGTRNHPVRYYPVYRTRRVSIDISKLTEEDQKMVLKRGWI